MGLHGSSTTPMILQDVQGAGREPARRGRQGPQGRVQRAELRAASSSARCAAAARSGAIGEAASTPAQRKQFGQPIASFGAIKHKLGEMVVAHLRGREPALPHRRADRRAHRRDAARRRPTARRRSRRSRSTRSRRRSPRSPAARRSTSCSTRTSRSTAATATSATIRPSATTATRASTASSRAPTRSTAC